MNILDRIIADKKNEVALRKSLFPISYWEASPLFDRPLNRLSSRLRSSHSGIIAEHKRRSPSKQTINTKLSVSEVVQGYDKAGACGLSILTDHKYFGGSLEDLNLARATTTLPLLRKEFIVDEYQLIEAKAQGADLILLIAAVLSREEIQTLSTVAQKLDLEVLLEIHNQEELEKSIMPSLDLLGVNNRNLKTFEIDINNSIKLSKLIPEDKIIICESGIYNRNDIKKMQSENINSFLIGESLMRQDDIEKALQNLIT